MSTTTVNDRIVTTDADTGQKVRELGDRRFQVKVAGVHFIVDVAAFSDDELRQHVEEYYDSLEECSRLFGDASDMVIAEILAERHHYKLEILEHEHVLAASLTVERVVAALDLETDSWKGNCYGVACAMLRAGLVSGDARYGLYHGPIAETSLFGGRALTHHGWIETVHEDDVYVVDPTRWVFEDVPPYIYVGYAGNPEYDAGSNILRMGLMGPPPAYNEDEPTYALDLSQFASLRLADLIGDELPITRGRLFWIANLDPALFGEYALAIYKTLDRAGWKAAVPIDNWTRVLSEKPVYFRPAATQGVPDAVGTEEKGVTMPPVNWIARAEQRAQTVLLAHWAEVSKRAVKDGYVADNVDGIFYNDLDYIRKQPLDGQEAAQILSTWPMVAIELRSDHEDLEIERLGQRVYEMAVFAELGKLLSEVDVSLQTRMKEQIPAILADLKKIVENMS